jgi:hypothetical protein
MRLVCCFLLLAAVMPAALSRSEAAEGWILLFDGETLFGWAREGAAEWRVADGVLTAEGAAAGRLRTTSWFAGYMLACEFRTSGGTLPSGKKAHSAAGQWHTYEVNATGERFIVTLDGKRLGSGREAHNPVGPIELAHAPGGKTEYRNVRLKPLGLQPLFDGKTLAGWHTVDAPKPPQAPPEWSVRDGMLHVEHGPGGLESEAQFGDFVLQLDVRANASDPQHHPNSGVFFRAMPGVFWSGYEAQIRNEWEGDDRTKPVDFGTGAIYRNQPARRVVSSDGEFFTMTVVARGRHLAVWVHGYPITDWDDPHPAGENVRKGEARLAAGPSSLQAHDPTTNLDFRNLRAAALPRGSDSAAARAARSGRRMRPHR